MVTLVVLHLIIAFEANTNVGADPGNGDIRLNQTNQNTSTAISN